MLTAFASLRSFDGSTESHPTDPGVETPGCARASLRDESRGFAPPPISGAQGRTAMGGTGNLPVRPGHWPGGMDARLGWERASEKIRPSSHSARHRQVAYASPGEQGRTGTSHVRGLPVWGQNQRPSEGLARARAESSSTAFPTKHLPSAGNSDTMRP